MTYEELEDAIIATLEPLTGSLGVRILESYGGEFSPDSISEIAYLFPAVFVHVPELQSEQKIRFDSREVTVAVYVAAKNARGESWGRRGDDATGSAGTYALLEGVRAKLNRKQIAGAGTFRLVKESNIGYSKKFGICVSRAEYRVGLRENA